MSPTVFRDGRYRFAFFSREESRMHVHVFGPEGEAKFWLEPVVAFAEGHGIADRDLNIIARIIKERRDELINAWRDHFRG